MSVRGYADYKPAPETVYWISRVLEVLRAYKEYWPLSVRQVFYRVVAEHGYPKSEKDYGKLTTIISRSRRAGFIPWQAIRDGGLGRTKDAHFYTSDDHFEETIKREAALMQLDRQAGQGNYIELWCEAGGMMPILEGIAHPYAARASTGGGYDSVTAKHKLAERVASRAAVGRRTVVLHVGDFDPSGEDMAEVLRDDAEIMVASQVLRRAIKTVKEQNDEFKDAPWDWLEPELRRSADGGPNWSRAVEWACEFFTVERVALTAEQVVEREVETAPPKPKDSRMEAFVERNAWVARELGTHEITAQLEALTPPELTEVLSGAIEAHLEMGVYDAILAREDGFRRDMLTRLGYDPDEVFEELEKEKDE